ncbi:MAG: dihydrolipoyl dehydrogenase [Deltaproteobacteria bacterium]|nr:dihydrolipoyl dehydrogenase [Deltaproteobacteria bacterium]
MSKRLDVDVAVVGAGTAGLAAHRAARAAGARSVLIEAGPGGTTCAREGCMPSKLLIAAAEAAHAAASASGFGVYAGPVRVDGRAVMARVRAERDRFVGFVVEGHQALPAEERLEGPARFVRDGVLDVGGVEVHARRVVLATGSSPKIIPLFEQVQDRLLTSRDVFEWDDLPESVALFGPGVIGLELGQALARLGVRVRIFGVSGSVGPLTDPVVRAAAADALSEEVPLHPDVEIEWVRPVQGGVEVRWREDVAVRQDRFQYVLSAIGRVPNLAGLGLENTSLPRDARGRLVFDPRTLQVGDAPVFVAGDVNDDRPLLHEAADEGRIAGENAARYPDVQAGLRRSPIGVVFSDPQIAMVGDRYVDLGARDVAIGEVSFADQGRSRVMRQNRGHLRVYADRQTGRFLGAEMVGPRAEHLAHLMAWAHQAGLTVPQMLDMPFYHPVVEEGLRTALRGARDRLAPALRRAA